MGSYETLSSPIEDRPRAKGAAFSGDEVEKLFMPFIDPEISRMVERFQRPIRRPMNTFCV